jgi:hypothetical protein
MSHEQELDSYWGFISRSIERILACLDGLSADELNWRPLDSANSLYVLATHILGTTEENILGVLCGQSTSRKREAEFAAQGTSVEPVRHTWLELRERIEQGLAGLPPGALEREHKHPRRGLLLGREVLIVVARHAAEHMGQAELTRDLLFASQGKTPPRREY